MEERVSQTFTSVGQATDWISCTFKNEDNYLDVGFEISSDWIGLVIVEKRYNSNPNNHYYVDYIFSETQYAIQDLVRGCQYRLRCVYYEQGEATGEIVK